MYILCFRIQFGYIYCCGDNQFPFRRKLKVANPTMSVDGAELLHVFLDVSTVRYAISFSGWLQFFSGWIGIETKVMPIKTRSNFQGRTHLTHQLTLIMNLVSIYRKADSLDLKKICLMSTCHGMSVQTPATRTSSTARLKRTDANFK